MGNASKSDIINLKELMIEHKTDIVKRVDGISQDFKDYCQDHKTEHRHMETLRVASSEQASNTEKDIANLKSDIKWFKILAGAVWTITAGAIFAGFKWITRS